MHYRRKYKLIASLDSMPLQDLISQPTHEWELESAMLEMAHQMVRRKSGTPESVANFLPSEVKARHVYSSCALPANTHIHESTHYSHQEV